MLIQIAATIDLSADVQHSQIIIERCDIEIGGGDARAF
jgi:hypothetical protein